MPDPMFALAVVAAAVLVAGAWMLVCGLRGGDLALGAALDLLTSSGPGVAEDSGARLVVDETSRLEHVGALAYQRLHLPVGERALATLALDGRSIGDFVLNKMVLCLVGLATPGLLGVVLAPMLGGGWVVPVGVGMGLGVLGWFWPDLSLRAGRARADRDASEAINTYFDLVMLERLANQSATGALESAAQVSEVPVFRRLRAALAQARYEQRPPWRDLHRCAEDLGIPAIADIADVMRLDDQGASLADVLGARVAELRDAHLDAEKTAATRTSERMTLWMTIPVIIFALVMLIPPMLRMATG